MRTTPFHHRYLVLPSSARFKSRTNSLPRNVEKAVHMVQNLSKFDPLLTFPRSPFEGSFGKRTLPCAQTFHRLSTSPLAARSNLTFPFGVPALPSSLPRVPLLVQSHFLHCAQIPSYTPGTRLFLTSYSLRRRSRGRRRLYMQVPTGALHST
jgi:hypothetical protein